MNRRLLRLVFGLALAAGVSVPVTPACAQPGKQPLYAYVSTGDNQWVADWPPVDSAQSVEALFDWLSATCSTRR